jgi:hypothetical protein
MLRGVTAVLKKMVSTESHLSPEEPRTLGSCTARVLPLLSSSDSARVPQLSASNCAT